MRTEKEIRAKAEAMKKSLLENVDLLPLVRIQILGLVKTLEWVLDDVDYKKRAEKLLRNDKWLFDFCKSVNANVHAKISIDLVESLTTEEWEELRAWCENELSYSKNPGHILPFPQSIIEASQKL